MVPDTFSTEHLWYGMHLVVVPYDIECLWYRMHLILDAYNTLCLNAAVA